MQTTIEIVKNITKLPLLQRLSIIENILQSVKDDTFKQIDDKQLKDVRIFYQTLLLNNETYTLHSVINQIATKDLPITKGDKKINPTALFGIWEKKPRNLQDLRQQDWKRNWDL